MSKDTFNPEKARRFRIGRFLYYQYSPDFLFWAHTIDIFIGGLKMCVCWKRTFKWSDNTFKKYAINIVWDTKKRFKTLYSSGTHIKKNWDKPDKYEAESEMENYYDHL